MYELKVTINDDHIIRKLHEKPLVVGAMLNAAINDIAHFAEATAKGEAGFRTGHLRRSISTREARVDMAGAHKAAVGVSRTARYAIWTHEGTGLFGSGHRISPARGNVLAFSLGGRAVFAKSVIGQRANPFMREAFHVTKETYVRHRLHRLGREIADL